MQSLFSTVTGSRFFSLVSLALIAIAIWWLEGIIHAVQENELREAGDRPDFYLEGFVLHQYDRPGHPQYRARGQSMIQLPGDDDGVEVEKIHLQQFPRQRSRITVTADQARLLEDGREVHLTGSVHIHQPKGRMNDLLDIRTERLFIDQASRYMETPGPITIKTSRHEISGTGMQAWTELGKYRLQSQVRGRHEP